MLERNEVHGWAADETSGENGAGSVVERLRCIVLHHSAMLEQHDPVPHAHRFDLVMGDVDDRHAESLLEIANLPAHFASKSRVQVGQGFIHQAERVFGDDRPGERDSLALAARELGRLARKQ
jgi:hypothetical protein